MKSTLRTVIPFAAALVFATGLSPRAGARIWHVNAQGTGDAATIQEAVDSAGAGDEIVAAPGIYSWSEQGHTGDYGMIFFARRVTGFTLRSEGGPEVTILDGEGMGRLMFIQAQNDIVVEGFTFVNGVAPESYDAGGGLIGHLSSPTIRNCIFTGNSAEQGGALWYGGVSGPMIEDCTFHGNEARYGGGVCLVNSYSTMRLSGCTITDNHAASRGGGILSYNCRFEIENSAICGNTAGERGGGVSFSEPETAAVRLCTLSGNSSADGGGIHVQGGASLEVTCSIIAHTGAGAAFGLVGESNLYVESCVMWSNNGGNSIPPGGTDSGNNIVIDPQFCAGPGTSNWMLQSDSPCLAPNHPVSFSCSRIGAFGPGCGTVGNARESWGGIKRKFR